MLGNQQLPPLPLGHQTPRKIPLSAFALLLQVPVSDLFHNRRMEPPNPRSDILPIRLIGSAACCVGLQRERCSPLRLFSIRKKKKKKKKRDEKDENEKTYPNKLQPKPLLTIHPIHPSSLTVSAHRTHIPEILTAETHPATAPLACSFPRLVSYALKDGTI